MLGTLWLANIAWPNSDVGLNQAWGRNKSAPEVPTLVCEYPSWDTQTVVGLLLGSLWIVKSCTGTVMWHFGHTISHVTRHHELQFTVFIEL